MFEEETKAGLEGYDRGQVTDLGAVNVMTGIYTGRSPKDKYIVMDANSKDTVWWLSLIHILILPADDPTAEDPQSARVTFEIKTAGFVAKYNAEGCLLYTSRCV